MRLLIHWGTVLVCTEAHCFGGTSHTVLGDLCDLLIVLHVCKKKVIRKMNACSNLFFLDLGDSVKCKLHIV